MLLKSVFLSETIKRFLFPDWAQSMNVLPDWMHRIIVLPSWGIWYLYMVKWVHAEI